MHPLLKDHRKFIRHMIRALHEKVDQKPIFSQNGLDLATSSAVLFLIGGPVPVYRNSSGPCLILNKRSPKVKQAGDLCCPGGSITPHLDVYLAKLLMLPLSLLTRWPHWSDWRRHKPQTARLLALLLATALRESVEEMRLNPFGLKFLGVLPPQLLVMFDRVIYPMVAWVNHQRRFHPNWEVDKIVYIPLQDLLNPANYVHYRLHLDTPSNRLQAPHPDEFPCFRHTWQNETELLWGATYRMTTVFLDYVFGFKPPEGDSLPVVNGSLNRDYLTGNA
jgi:hypothetical protein